MGHSVTVITGFPNWPTGKLYEGYKPRLYFREVIEGINVLRVPLFPDHSRSSFRRSLNFLSFAASVTLLGPFLARRPDVIHAIQPIPAGLSAVLLGAYWRVPVTVEVQDLWPETLQATGFVRNRGVLNVVRRLNTWILKRSARVRVISNGFRDALKGQGISTDKIHVISNWVDPSVFEPADVSGSGDPRSLSVFYAGSIGPAQDLQTLIEAVSLLKDKPEITFTIAGEGIDRERLEKMARERDLKNIHFLGWVAEGQIQPLLASADVLLIHLRDDPLFRITIPHKVFVYLAIGRPILAAAAGETADVVRNAGAGLTCPPGDPVHLANTVRSFAEMERSQREEYGRRGRRAACVQYSRSHLTSELERVLQQVICMPGVNFNPVQSSTSEEQPSLCIERMSSAHLKSAVGVHIRAFPQFFLSVLGPPFLSLLYREILGDPSGIAFVCLEGSRVIGFVVGTDTPAGFYRRLLRRSWWRFGMASTLPMLLHPSLLPRVLNAFRRPNEASNWPHDCELMSIAVDPGAQGNGAGTKLIGAFLRASAARGRTRVILTTDEVANEASNRFYQSRGFQISRSFKTRQNRALNEYAIHLDSLESFS
jgi:glycosyltransferase involved in cell wall biosynthesis/ribosomal protein S18 acetylase RimI-like enzyme